MGTKLSKKLTLALLLSVMLGAGHLIAQTTVTVENMFYGHCYSGTPAGPVKFSTSPESELTTIAAQTNLAHAGEYANGTWYVYLYTTYGGPTAFASVNLLTGATQNIAVTSGYGAYLDKDYVADITYSYSESKMYALKNTAGNILTEVSMTTQQGKHTALGVVTGTDAKLITLACNAGGQMYAIGDDAKLYLINQSALVATPVGELNIVDFTFAIRQSMTFNHSTGILYWMSENGKLYTVDTATGNATAVKTVTDGSRKLTGIFTPFEYPGANRPAAVQNLKATSGAGGALELSMEWTNPAVTLEGDATVLTSIKIYRDDAEYVSYADNLTAGAAVSWTDPLPVNGAHTYKVVPVNSNGEGAATAVTVYTGTDIPAPVTSLTVSKDSDGRPVLTWSAPAVGVNGGYIGELTYDVVRNPNSVTVAESISETVFTDHSQLELGKYTYSITAKNSAGSSTAVNSEATVLGSPYAIPWREDFDEQAKFDLWTVIDANSDSYKWIRSSYNGNTTQGSASSNISWSAPMNDWLITPPIQLNAFKTYVIKWVDKCQTSGRTANYKLAVGTGTTVDEQTEILSVAANSTGFTQREVVIPPAETASIRYFGWHNETAVGASGTTFFIDDIEITELLAFDLEAVSLKGNRYASAEFEQTFTLEVSNRGSSAVESFTVKLYDEQESLLATVPYNTALAAGELTSVSISWTPAASAEGNRILKAVIDLAADENTTNNSATFGVTVYPFGSIVSEIGDTEATSQYYMPFNLSMKHSMAQNIFFASEIGATGLIERITFFSQFTNEIVDVPVKIYMSTTKQTNVQNWNREASVPVYEGNITIPAGNASEPSEVTVELDLPFYYGGDNLVVRTERVMAADYISNSSALKFKMAKTGGDIANRSVYWSHNSSQFDWQNPETGVTYHPCITIGFNTNGNQLSGYVESGIGAVENVTVKILETPFETSTNEFGSYHFAFVPAGTYHVEFTKTGYETVTQQATVSLETLSVLNVVLESSAAVSVSGKALMEDMTAFTGVTVQLASADTVFTTTTDGTGAFLIENVYGDQIYTLHLFHSGCSDHNAELAIGVENVTVDDIVMTACTGNAISNLQATANTPVWYDIQLTWEEATPGIHTVAGHRIYRNGEFLEQIGANLSQYVDAGLEPDIYTYNVTVVWSNGCESGARVSSPIEIVLHECDIPLAQFPVVESFETGTFASCWSQQYMSEYHADWAVVTDGANGPGTGAGPINTPHYGQYNIRLYGTQVTNRLIMPLMDISALTSPILAFWHAQPKWFSNTDNLKVYYQNEKNGEWTLLLDSEYEDIREWREVRLELPNPSAHYRIAFEGSVNRGYGVVLDDIRVLDDVCLPVNKLTYVQETEKKLVLQWEAPDVFNLTSYTVLRDGETVAENHTELSFTETDAVIGSYEYAVIAVYDKTGCTESAETALTVEVVGKCEKVENLEATLASDSSVELVWTVPNAVNIESYKVYMNGELHITVTETQCSLTELDEGAYLFGVSAVYSGKECTESDREEVSIQVQCGTVNNFTVTLENNNKALLEWEMDENIALFQIVRNDEDLASTRELHYTDRGLAPGQTYTYAVIALYDAGCKSEPAEASVTTECDDVIGLNVTMSGVESCSATLNWALNGDVKSDTVFSNGSYYSEEGAGYNGYNISMMTAQGRVGYSAYRSIGEMVADDFVLTRETHVDEIDFYICGDLDLAIVDFDPEMQVVNGMYITLYESNPAQGAAPVWGSEENPENRFKSCSFAGTFRVFPDDLYSVERPLFKVTATINETLPAGQYWLAFNMDKNEQYTWYVDILAAPVPDIEGNAYRKLHSGIGTWEPATDFNGTQQALAFDVRGTRTAAQFNIYRNGVLISELYEGRTYVDTGIEENVEYTWEVANVCATGESAHMQDDGVCILSSMSLVAAETMRVYPNPARDHVTIEGNAVKADIYTLSGILVETVRMEDLQNRQIQLHSYLPGVYIFIVHDAGNTVSAHKIAVTK
ncbi:MAG: choice-of-anchor J domain-containing protein [Cytophagaceae bacterium]|jgi:hypothetical protein|nr:choice-of-anchor J domain-containing protein [Cytophagaceae bacterium]